MNESLEVWLLRFLIKYKVTPQQTNGIAPAELLMCRRIRTHLDLLDPTVQQQVKEWLIAQKERRGANAEPKNFEQGDWVLSIGTLDKSQSGSMELCQRKREREYGQSETGWWYDLETSPISFDQDSDSKNNWEKQEREIDFGPDSIETEPSEQVEPQKDALNTCKIDLQILCMCLFFATLYFSVAPQIDHDIELECVGLLVLLHFLSVLIDVLVCTCECSIKVMWQLCASSASTVDY